MPRKAPLDNSLLVLTAKVFARKPTVIFCVAALAIILVLASCNQAPSKDSLELKFNLLGLQIGMKLSDAKPILEKTMVGGIGIVEDKLSDSLFPCMVYHSKDDLMFVQVIPDASKTMVTSINVSANIGLPTSGVKQGAKEASQKAKKVQGAYSDTGQVFLGWSNDDVVKKLGESKKGPGSGMKGPIHWLFYSDKGTSVGVFIMDGVVCSYHVDAK
jgi:hypothetical protein